MSRQFFLGANSGSGFYSLYGEFCKGKGERLYLLKAGPGGGKSGFMRTVAAEAEKRGYEVETILCSGDPASLDGVYIPALHVGIVDATAPHVIEPTLFGVDGCYVNLGRFCTAGNYENIAKYTEQYKEMYRVAYAYLSAAASVHRAEIPYLTSENEINRAKARAKSTLKRELGTSKREGKTTRRFISCIGCTGSMVLYDTVSELCKRTYALDDRFGLEQVYLTAVRDHCLVHGIEAIVCPSPLCPEELDAVLIPERSLAFIKSSLCREKPYRHVRLDVLVPGETAALHKSEIRRRESLYAAAMERAYFYLSEAKRYHDLLEKEYKPLVDFEGLSVFRDEFVRELFSRR